MGGKAVHEGAPHRALAALPTPLPFLLALQLPKDESAKELLRAAEALAAQAQGQYDMAALLGAKQAKQTARGKPDGSKVRSAAQRRTAGVLHAAGRAACVQETAALPAPLPTPPCLLPALTIHPRQLHRPPSPSTPASSMQAPALADWVGPIEVFASPTAGRGLRTTKAVKAGELLLVEQALAAAQVRHAGRGRRVAGAEGIAIGGRVCKVRQPCHTSSDRSASIAAMFAVVLHCDRPLSPS